MNSIESLIGELMLISEAVSMQSERVGSASADIYQIIETVQAEFGDKSSSQALLYALMEAVKTLAHATSNLNQLRNEIANYCIRLSQ